MAEHEDAPKKQTDKAVQTTRKAERKERYLPMQKQERNLAVHQGGKTTETEAGEGQVLVAGEVAGGVAIR